MKKEFKAWGMLIAGVMGIGFSPALVKLLGIDGLGPAATGFWRNFTGAAFLIGWAVLSGKSLKLSSNGLKWAVLAGFFFALDLTFWHRSVMYAGSGISTVLGNTQVFITSVLSVFLFKEKLSFRFVLASMFAIAGVVMLSGLMESSVSVTPIYRKGLMYACVTAFMYAFYLISIKQSAIDPEKSSPMVFMGWVSLFASGFLLISCTADHGHFIPQSMASIGYVILLGVMVQGICWYMIASAMASLQAHLTSLILLLQPALAMVWGYVFFREAYTVLQITGALLILVSVYAGSFKSVTEK